MDSAPQLRKSIDTVKNITAEIIIFLITFKLHHLTATLSIYSVKEKVSSTGIS
jgi:hypothetical protein